MPDGSRAMGGAALARLCVPIRFQRRGNHGESGAEVSPGPSLRRGDGAEPIKGTNERNTTMAKRYGGDPFWLTAKFESVCACGKRIPRGARGFYYPNGRKLLCAAPECGEKAAREFASAAQDEAFMSGGAF